MGAYHPPKILFVLIWRIVEQRMGRIKSTLSRDLDHLFSTILSSLVSSVSSETSSAEKARWTTELTECIATYDVLGGWSDAEEVVRRDLVRPFVKRVGTSVIYSGMAFSFFFLD